MDDRVSTKVVASAMPMAVSSLRDTPIKGHRPRNFTKTKLLTQMVLIKISAYSVICVRLWKWVAGGQFYLKPPVFALNIVKFLYRAINGNTQFPLFFMLLSLRAD